MSLKTTIEIAAPPSLVREKFLDFPTLPTWHSSFFSSITTLPEGKKGTELVKGDKVKVGLTGASGFTGVVETNTPTHFAWTGSIPLLFTGTHTFSFLPSATTEGGTTFTQEEVFSGALGPTLMGEGWVGRQAGFREKTRKGWEGFDGDLKGVCEGVGK